MSEENKYAYCPYCGELSEDLQTCLAGVDREGNVQNWSASFECEKCHGTSHVSTRFKPSTQNVIHLR